MKALVKAKSEPGLWLRDVPEPETGINDVLIKVKRTAICGTDMHIYKWDDWAQKTIPVPMTVGHEFVGEIVKIGWRATNPAIVGVWKLLEEAMRDAIQFDVLGEDVLVVGAGPIGMMAAAVCRHAGARHVVITDINDNRLDMARKLGVTRAVNVSRETIEDVQKELGMSEGFDIGLEMSGNEAGFASLIDNMCHGGKVAILGLPEAGMAIDWHKVIFNMLTLKGVYGREIFETWYKMSVFIESGLDISPLITHRLPYTDFETGFQAMLAGDACKVVLNWED